MAAPQDVSMAPGIEVADGFRIRVTAIDASTGNTVAGVNVSNVVITGDDLTGSGGDVFTDLPPVLEYQQEPDATPAANAAAAIGAALPGGGG